jgi:monofunctional biosynthetic peptidoglycan transglycosylase
MHLAKRVIWIGIASILGFILFVWAGLPSRGEVRALAKINPKVTSVMRQRAREAEKAGRPVRRAQAWVPLSRVSRHLIHAIVAAEDPNFFGHEGVDWDAVRESIETNVKKGRFARGGSTITQQLAKNLFYTTYKNPIRKLREFFVARRLEEDLTKTRILELYLNVIEWGDGVYGAEAAAQRYYGKSVAGLNETEAAGLAAMVPSPRRINPRTNAKRHAAAQRRVLWLMARVGYVQRNVAGLGTTPPPPPVEDDGGEEPMEDEAAPETPPATEATPTEATADPAVDATVPVPDAPAPSTATEAPSPSPTVERTTTP